jgi:hypothetical protein
MTIALESMSVTMPHVVGHPNRTGFRGVLTVVDVPSEKSPSGAKGHLVMLTRRAAEEALPSLLGMALDYSPTWDRHDVRLKVGVITRAEVVERNVEVSGYLYARDFPEIVEEISKSKRDRNTSALAKKTEGFHAQTIDRNPADDCFADGHNLRTSLRAAVSGIRGLTSNLRDARRPRSQREAQIYPPTIRAGVGVGGAGTAGLGLSYEVTDVQLSDPKAQVWTLEKVTFTGAAILRRDKAAYRNTWIELSSTP